MASTTAGSTVESITNTVSDACVHLASPCCRRRATRRPRPDLLLLPTAPTTSPTRSPRPSAAPARRATRCATALWSSPCRCAPQSPALTSSLLPPPSPSSLPLPLPRLQEVAKGHTDASLGDRASAGFNAVGDKVRPSHSSSVAADLELTLLLSPPHADRRVEGWCQGRRLQGVSSQLSRLRRPSPVAVVPPRGRPVSRGRRFDPPPPL